MLPPRFCTIRTWLATVWFARLARPGRVISGMNWTGIHTYGLWYRIPGLRPLDCRKYPLEPISIFIKVLLLGDFEKNSRATSKAILTYCESHPYCPVAFMQVHFVSSLSWVKLGCVLVTDWKRRFSSYSPLEFRELQTTQRPIKDEITLFVKGPFERHQTSCIENDSTQKSVTQAQCACVNSVSLRTLHATFFGSDSWVS